MKSLRTVQTWRSTIFPDFLWDRGQLLMTLIQNFSQSYIGGPPGDHFGVHFRKWWGPNRSALQKLLRTTWECTLKSKKAKTHLHKPINTFRLIQRFRVVWPKVQEIFDNKDIVSIIVTVYVPTATGCNQLVDPGTKSFCAKQDQKQEEQFLNE